MGLHCFSNKLESRPTFRAFVSEGESFSLEVERSSSAWKRLHPLSEHTSGEGSENMRTSLADTKEEEIMVQTVRTSALSPYRRSPDEQPDLQNHAPVAGTSFGRDMLARWS
jgi:hypothetical protein